MDKHLAEAHVLLGYLRNGTEHYRAFITFLEQELAAGGHTLADLELTEAELETFRSRGARKAVYFMLKDQRRRAYLPEDFLENLQAELQLSGQTPEELELTEAEQALYKL